jgi:hypothetical protein
MADLEKKILNKEYIELFNKLQKHVEVTTGFERRRLYENYYNTLKRYERMNYDVEQFKEKLNKYKQ